MSVFEEGVPTWNDLSPDKQEQIAQYAREILETPVDGTERVSIAHAIAVEIFTVSRRAMLDRLAAG